MISEIGILTISAGIFASISSYLHYKESQFRKNLCKDCKYDFEPKTPNTAS